MTKLKDNSRIVVSPDSIEWSLLKLPQPPIHRGGTKQEKYPFLMMKVGESFFIPATKDCPEPWTKFPSTVAGANRRYKKNGEPHVFSTHRAYKGEVYENGFVEKEDGLRVFRVK